MGEGCAWGNHCTCVALAYEGFAHGGGMAHKVDGAGGSILLLQNGYISLV